MWKCKLTCNLAAVEIPGKLFGSTEPLPAHEVDATFRIVARIAQHLTPNRRMFRWN